MAYDFDGSGDYIEYETPPTSINGLSNMSVAFWITNEGDFSAGNRNVVWCGGAWPTQIRWFVQGLRLTGVDYLSFMLPRSSGNGRWTITDPDTSWHSHVITMDITSTTVDPIWYVDGSAVSTTEVETPGGTNISDTNDLMIGAGDEGGYEYWDGKIAEVAIWNRQLSAGEAAALGDGLSPSFIRNGLQFYIPLIRETGDIKGGSAGVVTNAVVTAHPRIIYPQGAF